MKRRILLVNKFYYPRGGDCICTINLEKLLVSKGFDAAVFSMRYKKNLTSVYDSYFASEVNFSTGGMMGRLKAMLRIFGMGDIKKSFEKILDVYDPHIVHLHNIHSYLSPVLAEMAYKRGCKVVWTLHDYKLICPSYSCLNKGKICELCFKDKSQVFKTRCMKGSLAASTLAYAESLYWNREKLERYVDKFICPSRFISDKMEEAGFHKAKLKVICNFIEQSKIDCFNKSGLKSKEDVYCYVGRLSPEKGVEDLLKAAVRLPYKLYVAGDGPLLDKLKAEYEQENIVFLGHLSSDGVVDLISRSKAMVIPSAWYENNPLSVIESLCMGTPVIGTKIGGIPELIENGINGCLVPVSDSEAIKEAVTNIFSMTFDYEHIAKISRDIYSAERYYSELEKIYFS